MDFHRIPAENIRDQIFKHLLDKGFINEGVTFEDLKKTLPFDDTEQITDNSNAEEVQPEVKEEVFNDNIQDDEDKVDEPVSKPKKHKKEKKDKSDKPSKPASSFVFFKSHPNNLSAIEEASKEINEDTGKPYGKVKGAGIVWGKMTDEEKKVWADKSLEDFNSKNQQMETAS
jgi:hypothetical protein